MSLYPRMYSSRLQSNIKRFWRRSNAIPEGSRTPHLIKDSRSRIIPLLVPANQCLCAKIQHNICIRLLLIGVPVCIGSYVLQLYSLQYTYIQINYIYIYIYIYICIYILYIIMNVYEYTEEPLIVGSPK